MNATPTAISEAVQIVNHLATALTAMRKTLQRLDNEDDLANLAKIIEDCRQFQDQQIKRLRQIREDSI